MSVDSGLPTYRDARGFWKDYPAYRRVKLDYMKVATPEVFSRDPELAWGFYGHRLGVYRGSKPHPGYEILKKWAAVKKSHFVFTSNVDGLFPRAGFDADRLYELHGNIFLAQCSEPCSKAVWPIDAEAVAVDPRTMRAVPPLPRCPRCRRVARPNVVLFGDGSSVTTARWPQSRRYWDWEQSAVGPSLTILEIGAGVGLPTLRKKGEALAGERGARLIRINPDPDPMDAALPDNAIVLRAPALAALRWLDQSLGLGSQKLAAMTSRSPLG